MRHAKRLPDRTAQLADGDLRLATAVRLDVNNNKATRQGQPGSAPANTGIKEIPIYSVRSRSFLFFTPHRHSQRTARTTRPSPAAALVYYCYYRRPALFLLLLLSYRKQRRLGAVTIHRPFSSAVVVGQPLWPNSQRSPYIISLAIVSILIIFTF